MENNYTATQSQRLSQSIVKYWMDIDRTDMELSGLPIKYSTDAEMVDNLGLDSEYIYPLLSRIKTRLARERASIKNNHGK